MGVQQKYHYTEPEHGNVPPDGIRATRKHGIDKLVVQDRASLRNAYALHLAANTHLSVVSCDADPHLQEKNYEFNKRIILYVPRKEIQKVPNKNVKAVQETTQLRFLQHVSVNCVETANQSCSCQSKGQHL